MPETDPASQHRLNPDAELKLPARTESLDSEIFDRPARDFFESHNGANYLQTDTLPPALNALADSKQRHEAQLSKVNTELEALRATATAHEETIAKLKQAPKAPPKQAATEDDAAQSQIETLRATIEEQAAKIKTMEPRLSEFEQKREQRDHRKALRTAFTAKGVTVDLNEDGLELAIDKAEKASRQSDGELEFLSSKDGATMLASDGTSPLDANGWLKQAAEGKTHWLNKAPAGSDSHQARRGAAKSNKRIGDMSTAEKSSHMDAIGSAAYNSQLQQEIAADLAEKERSKRQRA